MVATAQNGLARPANETNLSVVRTREEELAFVRQHFAPDLDDAQFDLLVQESVHRELDIVKKEIIAVKFAGKMTIFPTIHGLRRIAGRNPMYDGMDGPFFFDANAGPGSQWLEFWPYEDRKPLAAKVIVYRKDRKHPITAVATWKERSQWNTPKGPWNDRTRRYDPPPPNTVAKLNDIWEKMPSHMLGKVAISDGFKAAGLVNEDPIWLDEDVMIAEGSSGGASVVPNRRVESLRRLHAVGAEHGVDHDGVRAVVQQLNPGVASLGDETIPATTLNNAADLVASMPAEYVDGIVDGSLSIADAPQVNPHLESWNTFWLFMKSRGVDGPAFTKLCGQTAASFGGPATAFAAYRECIGETSPAVAGEVIEAEMGEPFDSGDLPPDWEETVDIAYLSAESAGTDETIKDIYRAAGTDPDLWATILNLAPTAKRLNHARIVQLGKVKTIDLDGTYALRELELKSGK